MPITLSSKLCAAGLKIPDCQSHVASGKLAPVQIVDSMHALGANAWVLIHPLVTF